MFKNVKLSVERKNGELQFWDWYRTEAEAVEAFNESVFSRGEIKNYTLADNAPRALTKEV